MFRILVLLLLTMANLASHAATINGGNKITEEVKGYLEEVLIAANIESISVSSGSRTEIEQARVMYDYYLKDNAPNCKCNKCSIFEERKACALNAYGSIGDSAINAITEWDNRDKSIQQMTAAIKVGIEAAGDDRNQMAHVTLEGRYAVDVKPSSVSDHEAFKSAVMNHKSVIKNRFFWPGKPGGPGETAFHIEFTLK